MNGMFAEVEFVKLDKDAQEPVRAHESDADNDLKALEDFRIHRGQTKKVRTGIALSVPNHCYGQVAGRSSLASKGIFPVGGVIDHGYTGECSVVLFNSSDEHVDFRKGDKIAQIIFLPIVEVSFKEVDALGNSNRGSNGFGSSGK
jgi:dUTP pyrophosphatase